MKVNGSNVRGFDLEQFSDSFARYLPPPAGTPSTRYPATSERESEHTGSKVAGESLVAGGRTNGSVAGESAEELVPFVDELEPDPCETHQCIHRYEVDCTRRCETEEQVVEQIHWLRRSKWTNERGGAHVEQPTDGAA